MRFQTPFNGYSVKFNPYDGSRVAVATAQNFGIIGNGIQHVLSVSGNGTVTEAASFETRDGLYDCCWSESHPDLLVAASGDGSVKVYDVSLPREMNPLRSFQSHRHEVYSVAYNQSQHKHLFLSASWDDTVKLWSTDQQYRGAGAGDEPLATFAGHKYCVYGVSWHPHYSDVFASCSGDCTVRLWDIRSATSSMTLQPHSYEVLAVDINKYNGNIIATASVDKSIKIWDMRNPRQELCVLQGHMYAVRRVLFSPFHPTQLYSCSYDMTMCMWDYESAAGTNANAGPLLQRWDHHNEFCVGIDASTTNEGIIASTGWDQGVYIWNQKMHPMR